jgi:hypothetical protein
MYDRDLRVWYRDLLFAQRLPGYAGGSRTPQHRAGDAGQTVAPFARPPRPMNGAEELQHMPTGLTADRPSATVEG